jgi:ubiquinone/menaquinone biosynthesis C-methylase UbiE
MTWEDQYQQDGTSAAELFQRYIVPSITSLWGKDLVDRACIRGGENVLDVACGTGVVTRLAAQQSGSGRVVGLDLNADMLGVASGIAHDGMPIEWRQRAAG